MNKLSTQATQPSPAAKIQAEEIDIRDLLNTLWQNKKNILLAMATCLLVAVTYLLLKAPEYESDILIQVQNKQTSIGSNLTQDIASLMGGSSQLPVVELQKALLTSRYILDPVIHQLGLDVEIKPKYFPLLSYLFAQKQALTLVKPKFGLNKYAWGGEQLELNYLAVPQVYEKKELPLKLVAGKDQHYQLFSPSGELLLEAKVGEVATTNKQDIAPISIQVKALTANPGTEFLLIKQNTAAVLAKLAKSIKINDLGARQLGNNTGVLQVSYFAGNPQQVVEVLNVLAKTMVAKNIETKTLEAEKTFSFLQQQLPIAKASLDAAETKLNKYRAKSGKLDLKLESQLLLTQLSAIEQHMAELKLQKTHLMQDYTSVHPFIAGINNKIKALEKALSQLQAQIKQLPASDQMAVGLMRDVEVNNQLYMLLLNKIQEIRVIKAGTVSDVQILDLAPYPYEPVRKQALLVIMAALFMGLILGVAIVLLRKALARYVEDPYWLEQNLGIANLAIVPYSKFQAKNISLFKKKKVNNLAVLAKEQPQDIAVESLRSLRTSIELLLPKAGNNIVSIMGISPGVGKSFISVNFAQVLADLNKRVLLIDGDIRKGYIQDYFKQKRIPGLTELLNGQASDEEVIYQTSSKNMAIIPCGTYVKNPSELLSGKGFKQLLDRVSKEYDLILIDTAPILAVTDGVIIAQHAAINLLVIGAGQHVEQEIDISLKRLENSQVKLSGTIFNNLHAKLQVYGNANYYYSYNHTDT